MALTLAQSAILSNDQRAANVMQTIATSSTVLDRLPVGTIEGNAYRYPRELAASGAEFRAVNSGYTESTGTFDDATESLVILGGDADVDRFIQQTRSNLVDQVRAQIVAKAKAVNAKFCDSFINGDTAVDANAFNGLKKRLTGGQLLTGATNGTTIIGNGASDIQTFFDLLDQLIAQVNGAEVLYTNRQILAAFRGAARRSSISQQTVDSIGRTVDYYNGVPILDVGNKGDGTQIIPQTETQGSSNVAGSIYAAKFAPDLEQEGVIGLTNGGVQVDPPRQLETKPALRVRIEWYTGLALFGIRPAARLKGILAS